jgi:NADH-quinone oxidoreductase subunit G
VAAAVAKSGSYLDWEGRVRLFDATLEETGALPDARVLDWIAEAMGVTLGTPSGAAVQREIQQLGAWTGTRPTDPQQAAGRAETPSSGSAVLATWHLLLDDGRLQDGEPYLAGTRKETVALLSETTAKEIGLAAGDRLTVSTDRGSVTVAARLVDMPERVVWLPTNSPGCHVHESLGVGAGAVVRISASSRAEHDVGPAS